MVTSVPALTVGGTFVEEPAFTVTVTVALPVILLLSVAASWKTYVPCTRPETTVLRLEGELIIAVLGPLTWVQPPDTIVQPLPAVAVPDKVSELVGSVIVWALPALTVGATAAAFTVTVTVELAVDPLLSLAVNLKV